MFLPSMPIVRLAALLVAVGTVAFLFIGDDWRWANLFLVPDLLLSAALILGAVLPGRRAAPVLAVAFAFAAGVFGAATMSYAVEGRFGPGAASGLVTAVIATLWLLRRLLGERAP